MTSVGARIRRARLEHLALTQRELGARIGVDAISISRWERGEVDPRPRHVRLIAELADLPVAWFYEEDREAIA